MPARNVASFARASRGTRANARNTLQIRLQTRMQQARVTKAAALENIANKLAGHIFQATVSEDELVEALVAEHRPSLMGWRFAGRIYSSADLKKFVWINGKLFTLLLARPGWVELRDGSGWGLEGSIGMRYLKGQRLLRVRRTKRVPLHALVARRVHSLLELEFGHAIRIDASGVNW